MDEYKLNKEGCQEAADTIISEQANLIAQADKLEKIGATLSEACSGLAFEKIAFLVKKEKNLLAEHAGQFQLYAKLLVEGVRYVYGVLTCHGVYDEEDLVRLNSLSDLLELVHEGFVYVEAACRIHDQYVKALPFGFPLGCRSNFRGVAAYPVRVDRNV